MVGLPKLDKNSKVVNNFGYSVMSNIKALKFIIIIITVAQKLIKCQ